MRNDDRGRSADKPIIVGRDAMRDLKHTVGGVEGEYLNYGRVLHYGDLYFAAEEPQVVNIKTDDG